MFFEGSESLRLLQDVSAAFFTQVPSQPVTFYFALITNVRRSPVNGNHETFPAAPEAVTFVGRPFPLEEAQEHFSRLRRWGLTLSGYVLLSEAGLHSDAVVLQSGSW